MANFVKQKVFSELDEITENLLPLETFFIVSCPGLDISYAIIIICCANAYGTGDSLVWVGWFRVAMEKQGHEGHSSQNICDAAHIEGGRW